MARRRKRNRFQWEIRLGPKAARVAGILFGVAMVAAIFGCVLYTNAGPASDSPDDPPERFTPEPLDKLDRIEGWIPSWGDEAKLARDASAAGFTDLLFFHGSVADDGSVSLEDEAGLSAGLQAAGGTRRWLTVTNHGRSLQAALIDDPDTHVTSLLQAFRRSGCDHLDLDYESLNYAQADALVGLAGRISDGLPANAKLSLTMQPVDDQLRPEQRGIFRRMLESPAIYTIRVMMYDYHWRNSLPGALYPLAAFERMLRLWARHAHKLTMCLPLYGYDWPRPEDSSIPRAEVVTLRDVRDLAGKPGFDAVWMSQEGELAARYTSGTMHFVALPSLRAIQLRVLLGLDWGVPGVSFWHLGCAAPGPVARACARDQQPAEAISYDRGTSWQSWLEPFKRRACKVFIADGTQTLEQIGEANGVSRTAMYRFNEDLSGSDLTGETVYIPR